MAKYTLPITELAWLTTATSQPPSKTSKKVPSALWPRNKDDILESTPVCLRGVREGAWRCSSKSRTRQCFRGRDSGVTSIGTGTGERERRKKSISLSDSPVVSIGTVRVKGLDTALFAAEWADAKELLADYARPYAVQDGWLVQEKEGEEKEQFFLGLWMA
ncbi:uncharacterized protein BCR38DRAFT_404758 [Pseudomassariella vexata]|uniref:Uncharacterized protein n=1 Tax=Pseudomassariella vexata TaxID=1141098 RepID=A0A1Y2ELH6_9PEZI|nr:uncharacterized protein BCR38DRAFT_404758 [Pseudomassariella vexata]ORY71705.1 hypothetical protein BCR38DRAFT_404758 [Pseudomassariella vexata]